MSKPIAVVAGSYRQFQDWMREKNLSGRDAVYVSLPEHAHGMAFSRVETVGNWYTKPHAHDLVALAEARVR